MNQNDIIEKGLEKALEDHTQVTSDRIFWKVIWIGLAICTFVIGMHLYHVSLYEHKYAIEKAVLDKKEIRIHEEFDKYVDSVQMQVEKFNDSLDFKSLRKKK